jgi:immune inhibitor A
MSRENINSGRRFPVALVGAIAALVLILFALCTCVVAGGVAFLTLAPDRNVIINPPEWNVDPQQDPVTRPTVVIPAFTPTPADVDPEPDPLPIIDEMEETLLALEAAEIPVSDLHELAIRFLGVPADTPRVASTVSPDYPVGTVRTFQVSNLDDNTNFAIQAELLYKREHVYMWVEQGLRVDLRAVQEAADLFEEHTYPTTREFFGSEWTPGVDGDPRLSILHARNLGRTVAGYFSSADSYVRAVRSDSNEMEMFYIHIDRGMRIGDPFYNGVLAHEFQHMIHWYNDRNETTWLNEGCSELAMELNNRRHPDGPGLYDVGGSEYAYLDRPDTQLTTWPEVSQTGSAAPHYGAAYLFVSYFLDRFGEDATKALVAHPANGMESFDLVLRDELGLEITHEDLFADWVIANMIDAPELDQGQYGYNEINVSRPRIDKRYPRNTTYPQTVLSTVNQYGVDYIEIEGQTPLEFRFSGSTETSLIATTAYSGRYLWWSNRADESNPRLTRLIDLTDNESARLSFQAWYHIEEDWDYAYVVVGTTADGTIPDDLSSPDIAWTILRDPGLLCTTSNPNNGNLGCGFTGSSNGWDLREADLSAYTGQEIALRFEYVTDAAVNQAGFAIDDVSVVADGDLLFFDDIETLADEWFAEGFVRHANLLAQKWIVQLLSYHNSGEITVDRLIFTDQTAGLWTIPLSRETDRAILAISALAPVTTEVATYEYTLSIQP